MITPSCCQTRSYFQNGERQGLVTSSRMARTADRRKDLRRKKQHRALKPNKAPVSELSPKSRRWRTVVLVLSVILFVAGVLIVVVPLATMATMVPGNNKHIFTEYTHTMN